MKRKMIGAAAAYMSGLFFASFFTEGSDLLLLAGMLPLFFIVWRLLKKPISDFIVISVFFFVSCTVGMLYNNLVYDRISAFYGTEGSFSGKIKDVKVYDGDLASYTLSGKINGVQNAEIIFLGEVYNAEYGDTITLENCVFEAPESDFLFDYETYYKSQNIFTVVKSGDIVSIERNSTHKFLRAVKNYRERMISEFRIKLGSTDGSFLAGIVFGEKSGIDDNEKALMNRCGIRHILAVSGLHVSILAALLMVLLKRLRLGRYISFGIINIFMAVLIIMADMPISGIRAAIMLDFIYSARIFRRQNDSFNSLAAAVLMICISNPYVIYDSGFLLSVSGTFGIAVFAPYMTKNMKTENLWQKFVKNIAVMFFTSLAIMPLNIILFDETSVISPITNVFIVPLIVAALVIGGLYAVSGGVISILSAAELLIDIVRKITDFLGRLSFTHFSFTDEKLTVVVLMCTAAIIITAVFFHSRRLVSVAVACSIAIFVLSSVIINASYKNELRIAVLGKGTNAAVVIMYKGRTDIVDLSGNYKDSRYVRKYLAVNGVTEVNTLTLTANAASQFPAYLESLELYNIGQIFSEKNLYLAESMENETDYFMDGSIELKNSDYEIYYEDGRLTISCGNASVFFAPAKENVKESSGISVFYGNITQDTDIFTDGYSIYLDEIEGTVYPYSDMNNFEIIVSESGKLKLKT